MFWRSFAVVLFVFVFGAVAFGVVRILFSLLAVIFVVFAVRIVAQLIAVTKVINYLAREFCESGLISQTAVQVRQSFRSGPFKVFAPQIQNVLRALRQIAACRKTADQISGCHGQWCFRGFVDLAISTTVGLICDFGVNVACGSGHGACANGLTTGCFHRLVQVTRHLPVWFVPGVQTGVVILASQRICIGRPARQQDFVLVHPATNLRQTHLVARHTGRVHGIGHPHIRIVRQNTGCFSQRLLKGFGGIFVLFTHGVARLPYQDNLGRFVGDDHGWCVIYPIVRNKMV